MRVVVLRGGRSSEHDVSLAGGAAVAEGLRAGGHDVEVVDIDRRGVWRRAAQELELRPGRGLLGADVAFPVLHGPFGEDGSVQGALEILGVPYVGSGVAASAVCIDKLLAKDRLAHAGLPQVAYAAVTGDTDPEVVGLPCWVKPARLGSSVGIARVTEAGAFAAAFDAARAHDPRVIVEAEARGAEVECSVLGPTEAPEAGEPGEIVLRSGAGWYDYEAKYAADGMQLVVPARISGTARDRVRALAVEAFAICGCSGLARIDFFVDGEEVLVNELNTMPGQTATSVYAKLWEACGIPYPELLERLCRIGIARAAAEAGHRF